MPKLVNPARRLICSQAGSNPSSISAPILQSRELARTNVGFEDIRSLIGEVVITPGEKRGESHAALRGELMAILDLAAGRPRSPKMEVITNALACPCFEPIIRKVYEFSSRDRLIRSSRLRCVQPRPCNEEGPGRNLQCGNKKPPRWAACWLGDELKFWSLSFGRLLA